MERPTVVQDLINEGLIDAGDQHTSGPPRVTTALPDPRSARRAAGLTSAVTTLRTRRDGAEPRRSPVISARLLYAVCSTSRSGTPMKTGGDTMNPLSAHAAVMSTPAAERRRPPLRACMREHGPVCVGIDPHASALRGGKRRRRERCARVFSSRVVEALGGRAAAFRSHRPPSLNSTALFPRGAASRSSKVIARAHLSGWACISWTNESDISSCVCVRMCVAWGCAEAFLSRGDQSPLVCGDNVSYAHLTHLEWRTSCRTTPLSRDWNYTNEEERGGVCSPFALTSTLRGGASQ